MLPNPILEILLTYWSPSKEIKSWRQKYLKMYMVVYELYDFYSNDGVITWERLNDGYKILRPQFLNEREQLCEKIRSIHCELWRRRIYNLETILHN